MDFLEFLEQEGYITAEQKDSVDKFVDQGEELESALEKVGLSNSQILLAKGQFYHVPVKHIDKSDIPESLLNLIPDKSIDHYQILFLGKTDEKLQIGFVDPSDTAARDAVDFIAASNKTS